MKFELTEKQVRTLLKTLIQADYEFSTTSNLCVTDRPDLISEDVAFEINFSEIRDHVREQINMLKELVEKEEELPNGSKIFSEPKGTCALWLFMRQKTFRIYLMTRKGEINE